MMAAKSFSVGYELGNRTALLNSKLINFVASDRRFLVSALISGQPLFEAGPARSGQRSK